MSARDFLKEIRQKARIGLELSSKLYPFIECMCYDGKRYCCVAIAGNSFFPLMLHACINRIRKETHGEKLRNEIIQIMKGRLEELRETQVKA